MISERPGPVRELFGTDGIRGRANAGVMTPENAFRLGASVTLSARNAGIKAPRVVVGKDTRVSCYMLETALASGVCALGGRVLLCGPIPTPAVAHLTQTMRADVGVMISASHNGFEDNGIKLFGRDGFKLADALEVDLERMMAGQEIHDRRPTGRGIGTAERIEDAGGRYVTFVKSTFPKTLSLTGLRVVIDAAHGAGYRVAPLVLRELGAEVIECAVAPNGHNINEGCGATYPGFAASKVREHQAHIGLALDGDADRLIVVDERGECVDGDAIMSLCAHAMIEEQRLQKNTVVATVMSNLGLEHALSRDGAKLVRCDVGDRYVVEAMRAGGYNFGGEQSGHMVFLDHTTTGDGLITGLQVLALLCRTERPLSELANAAIERVPQTLLNVRLPTRRSLSDLPGVRRVISDVSEKLGNDGRVLVRWSGTETKLRVMVEGPDMRMIEGFAEQIAQEARVALAAAT